MVDASRLRLVYIQVLVVCCALHLPDMHVMKVRLMMLAAFCSFWAKHSTYMNAYDFNVLPPATHAHTRLVVPLACNEHPPDDAALMGWMELFKNDTKHYSKSTKFYVLEAIYGE